MLKGEVRADWRSSWIAVRLSPTLTSSAGGIDILLSRNKRPSEEELEDIRSAIASNEPELAILPVLNGGERDGEVREENERRHREWEKRTGTDAGISPDLTYEDEEEGRKDKKISKCEIQ